MAAIPQSKSHSCPHDRRVALALGVCCFVFYAGFGHGHFAGTDEGELYLTTASLYLDQDLAIETGPHVFKGRDGRKYSIFSVGQALAALPFYALGDGVERLLSPVARARLFGRGGGSRIDQNESPKSFAVSLFGPAASAILVGLFFLFERRLGVSLRSAVLSAALLAGCSYVAAMSVFFLRHTLESIAILGALYGFFSFARDGRIRGLVVGSLLMSLTVWIRLPSAVAALGLGGYGAYVLFARIRKGNGTPVGPALAALVLPALGVVALYGAFNGWVWGSVVPGPRFAQAQLLDAPLHTGVLGLLASPGSSLFVYSPLLFLLPWTGFAVWRRHRAATVSVLVVVASVLLLSAGFAHWHGLWSAPGPRMIFVATPLLLLSLGVWLDRPRRKIETLAVVVLGLFGFAVQLSLMSVRWGAVVRNMGYPAFAPEMDFLFIPHMSPIVGSARGLLAGDVDVWLWSLWVGTATRAPEPALALVFSLVWVCGFALALAWLGRTLRAQPARDG